MNQSKALDWLLSGWFGFAIIMLFYTAELTWAVVISIMMVGIGILDRLDKLGKK